jgi:hypothetical protein
VTIAPVPIPASGSFELIALGETVSLTPTSAGELKIFVNGLTLKEITPKKADGSPTGLGSFDSPCTLPDSEPRLLHTVKVTGGGGPTTPPSTTTAPPVTTTTAPPVTTTTTPGTTTTTNPPGGAELSYSLAGESKLANFGGSLPLTGGFKAVANVAQKTYVGDLSLDRTTSKDFKIMGFIPITAEVAFEQVSKFSGTLPANGLTVDKGQILIKLPKISLYGFPLTSGDGCQASEPTDITLKSSGGFDPFAGGKLVGAYSISGSKGCGQLNDWISPFVASTGNTIEITLTKK